MHCVVIRDVIAIVAQGRGEEWHEPYRAAPHFPNVVELLFQPSKITDAIPITIVESAYVRLIDDRVLVPKHILIQWQTASSWTKFRHLPAKAGRYASLVVAQFQIEPLPQVYIN